MGLAPLTRRVWWGAKAGRAPARLGEPAGRPPPNGTLVLVWLFTAGRERACLACLASQARRQRRRGGALEQIGLECDELPLRRGAFGTRLRALHRRILDHCRHRIVNGAADHLPAAARGLFAGALRGPGADVPGR